MMLCHASYLQVNLTYSKADTISSIDKNSSIFTEPGFSITNSMGMITI